MWLAGGLAVVVTGILVVVLALLEDDRDARTPSRRGTITAAELRSVELPVSWRGYDRGHVDALLARAAQALEDVGHYGVTDDTPAREDPAGAWAVGPAAPPSFLSEPVAYRDGGGVPTRGSGEELEDGGGDDAGGLDR